VNYKDKKSGQRVTAQDFNSVTSGLEQQARLSVVYPLALSNQGNNPTLSIDAVPFWARVYSPDDSDENSDADSDGQGLHWRQVAAFVDSGSVHWYETGLQGWLAFEVNGNTLESTGVYRLYPIGGGGFVFELAGAGGGGSSNSSDYPEIPTRCVQVLANILCEDGSTVLEYVWLPVLANVDCTPASDSDS
jgi:hypothetical protein